MTNRARSFRYRDLDRVVRALCPYVEESITGSSHCERSEGSLRRELVSCILGSQVSYESARDAVDRLDYIGLLDDRWWSDARIPIEARIADALSGRISMPRLTRSYRFPNAKARQLAAARDAVVENSLLNRLSTNESAEEKRRDLVRTISGLGPKQASMFLRNTGESYDLAIIDTHVVRFFDLKGRGASISSRIGTLRAYESAEHLVKAYAEHIGYAVGHVDWAIWATMRASKELAN